MSRALGRLAFILAAGLAAAGCGGNGRDEAVKTAETWLRAVGERDAERACELTSETAVNTLRRRSGLDQKTSCLSAIRVYSDAFEPGAIDEILKVGLEVEGPVKEDRIGVFPRTGPRELQVILMRRIGDEWKVATTSLGPTEPDDTATPDGQSS